MSLTITNREWGRLILIYIIVLPFIFDLLNGYTILKMGVSVVSPIYRISILFLFIHYSLKYKENKIIHKFFFLLWFLFFELSVWILFSDVQFFRELSFVFNWLLFFAIVALVYFNLKHIRINHSYIMKLVVYYGVWTAIVIIMSLIFNIGKSTYSDLDYGFGTTSFYIAGNVLGLSLVVSLWTACIQFLYSSNFKNFIYILIILIGSISVGTRTGFIMSTLIFLVFMGYYSFSNKGKKSIRLLFVVIIIPIIVVASNKAVDFLDNYKRISEKMENLEEFNVRGEHKSSVVRYFEDRDNIIHNVFGEGYTAYTVNYAPYSPRSSTTEYTIAEQDLYDMFGVYGIVSIVFYIPILGMFFSSLKNYLRTKNKYDLFIFGSILLFLGHSTFAGHVFLSSKSLQFLAVFIGLKYYSKWEKSKKVCKPI